MWLCKVDDNNIDVSWFYIWISLVWRPLNLGKQNQERVTEISMGRAAAWKMTREQEPSLRGLETLYIGGDISALLTQELLAFWNNMVRMPLIISSPLMWTIKNSASTCEKWEWNSIKFSFPYGPCPNAQGVSDPFQDQPSHESNWKANLWTLSEVHMVSHIVFYDVNVRCLALLWALPSSNLIHL